MKKLWYRIRYTWYQCKRIGFYGNIKFGWEMSDCWIEGFGMEDHPRDAVDEEISNWND